MDLKLHLQKGKITVDKFFEFIHTQDPRTTHDLSVGDYVVFPNISQEDLFDIEEIVELNSQEKGDFTTKRSFGPISGNVFIKSNEKGSPKYTVLLGNRINMGSAVYDRLNIYLQNLVYSSKQTKLH